MTTKEAKDTARRLAKVDPWSTDDRKAWQQARDVLVEDGICPACYIDEGKSIHLMPWTPGDAYMHAGCECPQCEEFFKCGEQPEYAPAGGGCEEHSDADPGL